MPQSIENKIITKLKKAKRGSLFFTRDFVQFGKGKSVGKALERLTEKGEIVRVAHGIYTRPRKSRILGHVLPTADDIAKAIAKRDRARITPTGDAALHALGLTNQVPANVVYLTDGFAKKVRLKNQTITFKRVGPKNFEIRGRMNELVIQALKEIGKDNVTDQELKVINEKLKQEKITNLNHDIPLVPEWIREIMRTARNESAHGI